MAAAITTAFALSPGWWIVVGVALLLILAAASTLFGARGSAITPRRYKRPTSATPAPGSRGPAQLSGRDEARQAWESHPRRRA